MPFQPPTRFNIAHYFLDARLEEGRGDRTAILTDTCRELAGLDPKGNPGAHNLTPVEGTSTDITWTVTGVRATTVAVRGRPDSTATSPKKSPASRRRMSNGCP